MGGLKGRTAFGRRSAGQRDGAVRGAKPLRVIDDDVTLPTGETVHNPFRVLPNGTGSEVVFTVFRRAGILITQVAEDAKAVEQDLGTLKRLLEATSGS